MSSEQRGDHRVMALSIVPVTFRQAREFIQVNHRHHRPPQGMKFALGVATHAASDVATEGATGQTLVGVAVVGRPVARHLDDTVTLEVTRSCTDGTRNANSMLYAAAWRITRELGYRRLVTYTEDGESGASLRAAGFQPVAHNRGHHGWNRPSRQRTDPVRPVARTRWELTRSTSIPAPRCVPEGQTKHPHRSGRVSADARSTPASAAPASTGPPRELSSYTSTSAPVAATDHTRPITQTGHVTHKGDLAMTRHPQPPTPISRSATAPHGPNRQDRPRPKWWEIILRWLGHSPAPEWENRWATSKPKPEPAPEPSLWTPEESRVLQRYHARNLAAARRTTEQLVREGWHTGPVPYGYRPQRIRISPAGQRPRYRTRLVIEPVEASVVKMIFLWRVQDTLDVEEIVERLNAARYPAPIRAGVTEPRGWAGGSVVAILANPKYTGYQVWGRTHNGSPAPSEQWVWSGPWAHPPVIDTNTFRAAQQPSPRLRRLPTQDGQIARAA